MPDTLEYLLRQQLSDLQRRDALQRELDKLVTAWHEAALEKAYSQEGVSREDAAVLQSNNKALEPQKRDAVLRALANRGVIEDSEPLPERERFQEKQREFEAAEAGCRASWNQLRRFLMQHAYGGQRSSLRKYLNDHRELLKLGRYPVAYEVEDLLTICAGADAAGPRSREHGQHSPDSNERKNAYAALKLLCRAHGKEMREEILAHEANPNWHTRDPIVRWKQLKDRPGDDGLIRSAMDRLTEEIAAAKS
jgi:hypothetical protein